MIRASGVVALVFAFALVPLAAIAQPARPQLRGDASDPAVMASVGRYRQAMTDGVPAGYRALRDASPTDRAKLARGAALYADKCAACHGASARGTGPVSRRMLPHPADLEWLARMPRREAEPYMYWAIAEGGRAFGSDMPAFKTQLSRAQTWAVVAYLRAAARTPR